MMKTPLSFKILALLGILFYITRVCMTGELVYGFLLWNLFLAWLPIPLASWAGRSGRLYWLVLCAWFLVLPNSPYIITDYVHLSHSWGIRKKLYDGVMIGSFASAGIMAYITSVDHVWQTIINLRVMQLLKDYFSTAALYKFYVLFIGLSSGFGIYLGRILRFNSWDVLTDPRSLAIDILRIMLHPADHVLAYVTTFSLAILLYILHFAHLKITIRASIQ